MRYLPLPASDHTSNRQRLARDIGPDAIAIIDTADVLRRPGDFEYPFRPDSNFYHLTGIDEPEAVLLLVPGHPNKRMQEILFLRQTDELHALWSGQLLTQSQAAKRSGIKTVLWLSDLSGVVDRLLPKFRIIYLNADMSLESGPLGPSARRAHELARKLPLHELRSATDTLGSGRTIKTPGEISQIRHAIDITASGLEKAWSKLRLGTPEYALEAELTAEFTRCGATGPAFSAIVATGKNTTVIHFAPGETKISANDLVLFDVGAEYGYYGSDISRTVPANGRFTPRQRGVYDAVYRVQLAGIALHKPGATIMGIDEQMRQLFIGEIQALGLISKSAAEGKNAGQLLQEYYPHISHHLGLDVHDTGDARLPFEPGMIVTCELGLYLPKEGIGVRLEDDILITKTGHEVLSGNIPSAPDEIERLMQSFAS